MSRNTPELVVLSQVSSILIVKPVAQQKITNRDKNSFWLNKERSQRTVE